MSSNTQLMSNFVRALAYYQTLAGKTKKEVAEAIGVPPTTFSSWSNGKHLPDMNKLQALADYLQAPIDEFFEFTALSKTPDPLVQEMLELYTKLHNEDKLMVRSLVVRLLQSK